MRGSLCEFYVFIFFEVARTAVERLQKNVFSILAMSMFLSLMCSCAPVAVSLRSLLAATRLELLVCHSSVDRLGSLACCGSVEGSFSFLLIAEILAELRFSFVLLAV